MKNEEDSNTWKPPSPPPPPPPPPPDLKLWEIIAFTIFGVTVVRNLRKPFVKPTSYSSSSSSSSYQEEAWRRYNKRMQEELEEELERIERIRRMQSVFNRERNKFRKGFENWNETDHQQQYHQQFQRHDWYWKTNQRTSSNTKGQESGGSRVYPLSHHYSVLGLSRSRGVPYSEAEIKKAFRVKAMEFHPDLNKDDKDVAEAKFKEVLSSYEAIKKERKEH